MSKSRQVFAFVGVSCMSGACAVYDSELLTPLRDGEVVEDGSPGSSAPPLTGAAAGGTTPVSDSPPTAGSSPAGGSAASAGAANAGHFGDAGNGGDDSLGDGGSPNDAAAGGEAPSSGGASGGSGGSAGTGAGGSSGGQGGSGGTAGAPAAPTCAAHPLPSKAKWSIAVSDYSVAEPYNPASNLLDDSVDRWSTGEAQSGDEWLQLDFGTSVSLRSINLQQGGSENDYPRSYAVIVSNKAKDLTGTVRASGPGTSGVSTTIVLPQVFVGRYLLIKQLGTSLAWWSVVELELSCFD